MNVCLNRDATARVAIFTDPGSLLHFGLGWVAGSPVVSAKQAVMLLAAFAAYQLSQQQSGADWSRTGGEFMEFALGMLAGGLM